MRQAQLVRVDSRTARRLLKLVRAQLASLPSPSVPLALLVPHFPNLPLLSTRSLQSLSHLSSSLSSSLPSLAPTFSASLPTLSLASLPLDSVKLDAAQVQSIITGVLNVAHTRLPQALTRSIPTDARILHATVQKLAYTQARAYTIRYGIQVALSFALRLLPEVGRGLPVPLRLAVSLSRLLLRQAVGQFVRVVVGVLLRQMGIVRRSQVRLGKGAAMVMKEVAKTDIMPPSRPVRGLSSDTSTVWLDGQMYPRLLDDIVAYAPYTVLITLRCTSRSLKRRADAALYDHLIVMPQASIIGGNLQVSTPHGRHPALYNWPSEGARGIVDIPNCVVDDDHSITSSCEQCENRREWIQSPLSTAFKFTRIVDIAGPVVLAKFRPLSSLFSALEYMRFKPSRVAPPRDTVRHRTARYEEEEQVEAELGWGNGGDGKDESEDDRNILWPMGLGHSTLLCSPKTLVWLGDLHRYSAITWLWLPSVPGAAYVYSWLCPGLCDPSCCIPTPERASIIDLIKMPHGAASVTIVYRSAGAPGTPHALEPTPMDYDDAIDAEPSNEASFVVDSPLTVAGLFDLDMGMLDPLGETREQCVGRFMRRQLREALLEERMGDEELDAQVEDCMARLKMVPLGEYATSLGAAERRLVLGDDGPVPVVRLCAPLLSSLHW